VFDVLQRLVRVQFPSWKGADYLRESHDRIHRGAQLVAGGRQEIGFGLIGAYPLDAVGFEPASQLDMIGDDLLHFTGAVVTTFGAKSHLRLESRADLAEFLRDVPEFNEPPVREYQLKLGVKDRDPGLQMVQSLFENARATAGTPPPEFADRSLDLL